MKKSLMAFLSLLFCLFSYANTQPNIVLSPALPVELVRLEPQELPLEIKESLNTKEYKDWHISAVLLYVETETYVVELKSDYLVKVVRFDCEGNKIVSKPNW